MKNISRMVLGLMLISSFISCTQKEKKVQSAALQTVHNLVTNAAEFVGTNVTVKGTVVHVCKHGGKRMFIIGNEPESRFKITAGKKIGSFDIELEGSNVQVTGVIQEQKVDQAFLDNWESELENEHEPEVAHEGHEHDHAQTAGEVDDHHENASNQIKMFRERLAKSDKDFISFYSMECETFEELN